MNVLIAARGGAVRHAIGGLLRATVGITSLREAENDVDALLQFSSEDWGLVILGIQLPEQGGLHVLRLFKTAKPAIPVVVVGSYVYPPAVKLCLEAGASGYVVSDALAEELLPSVQAALSGEVYLSRGVAEALEAHDRSGTGNKPSMH